MENNLQKIQEKEQIDFINNQLEKNLYQEIEKIIVDNIEITRIRFTDKDYIVHFNNEGNYVYFEVYPISIWLNNKSDVLNFSYKDKEDECHIHHDIFDKEKVLLKMSGSICWRGDFEGRLYFHDDEYWSEELLELSNLFTQNIEPLCKELLQKQIDNKTM